MVIVVVMDGVNIMVNPIIIANKPGIPRLENIGYEEQSDKFVINFRNHKFLDQPFNGILIIRLTNLPQRMPSKTLVFNTNSKQQTVTTPGGQELNASDVTESIYLMYYDSYENILQTLGI